MIQSPIVLGDVAERHLCDVGGAATIAPRGVMWLVRTQLCDVADDAVCKAGWSVISFGSVGGSMIQSGVAGEPAGGMRAYLSQAEIQNLAVWVREIEVLPLSAGTHEGATGLEPCE